MKQTFTTLVILSVLTLGAVRAPAFDFPELPDNFTITERWISWTTTFDLASKSGRNLGVIKKRMLSWTTSFDWADAAGQRVGTAKEVFLAWGATIDVFDARNNKIGAIKEQIFKSLFKPYTTYSILDASGREVATSEKVDWFATTFTLRDPKGYLIAEISRPGFRLRDQWSVGIADHKALDPRLLVMIGVYKTDVDHERASSSH